MTRKSAHDYRYGTKQRMIADLVARGLTRREIFAELRPWVTEQRRPMIFRQNVGGARVALPIEDQYKRLWFQIGRVMAEMTGIDDSKAPMPDVTSPEPEPVPEIEPEPEPEPASVAIKENPVQYLVRRLRELAAFCDSQAEIGERADSISTRPFMDGVRAVREGIHPNVILHNVTMLWEPDVLAAAGALDVRLTATDLENESARLAEQYGLPSEGLHKMAGLVIAFVRANVPVYMVGPSGSGKSHLARQVADYACEDGLEYAECPLTSGATPSWLLGNVQLPTPKNPEGFMPRPLTRLYENGGLFCFEEMDAADENMILVANNLIALATGEPFFNPASGDNHIRHERMRFIATGNTHGTGADINFTGRSRLDAATMDRFRTGRVLVDMDYDLIQYIAVNQAQPTLD